MTKAALIIIGNEILSGRTQDLNLNYIANRIKQVNIYLTEAAVIRDEEEIIIDTVRRFKEKYDYVFTCGGIGPTHDDITTATIAKALDLELELNQEAYKISEEYYGKENLNEARKKMSYMPKGAKLIKNPVSAIPAFYIDSIFVLAGVPKIMQAMLEFVIPLLKGGDKIHSVTISTNITEGNIAVKLKDISEEFSELEIGSYPFIKASQLGTSLVISGTDQEKINLAYHKLKEMIITNGGNIIE